MKKKLLAALTLTLCLLMLCTACGKDKQPSSDDITPPDNTQDITPDNTQNVTPPDTTADDNKTSNEPAPPVQDDPTPPAQDDPTPPVQDDPTPPADPDPTPPVQDEPKEPIPSVPYEAPAINYSTPENTTALQNYYAFLTGEATAYDFLHEKTTSFNDITKNGDVPINWFGLVDFGADGIFEVYMIPEDSRYSKVVLFFDNGNLYVDYIAAKGTEPLHLFGIVYVNAGSRTGNYWVLTVSAENGLESRDIAGVYKEYTDDWSGKVYYTSSTYENGVFLPAEKMIVSKDEYEAYTSPIDSISYIQTFEFSISKIQQVFLDIK